MNPAPVFCTIVAKNYLAHARVLARSVALAHPGRVQGGERGGAQLGRGIDEVELDYQTCWRIGGRRAGVCCSAYSL